MEEKELNNTLREIVLQYGIERVDQALLEIRKPADGRPHRSSSSVTCSKSRSKPDTDQRRKAKITATGFVLKLEVSSEVKCLLEELATKYENKEFLPTVGEIRNFYEIHGIDVPNSFSPSSGGSAGVQIPITVRFPGDSIHASVQFVFGADSTWSPLPKQLGALPNRE